MEKGPAQIAATQIRDFLEAQWHDLQTEGKLLLEQTGRIGELTFEQVDFILDRALCKAFGIPVGDLTPIQESSFGEKIDFIKEKVNNLAQGIGHVLKVHAESLQQDMAHFDIQGFTESAQKGSIEEARSVLAEHISGDQRFQAILGRVKENLSHPVAFIGNITRGTLGMLDIAKNVALEALIAELRTPAEQQAALAQYTESFENLTSKLQNLTERQLDQLTAHIAADIITLDALNSAYSALRSSSGASSTSIIHPEPVEGSSSSGTGIVARHDQLPATQRPTFDLRSKSKAVAPKVVAAQQTRQQSGASFHPELVEGSSSSTKPHALQKFETKYAKYRTRYNTIAETGEKVRIPFPKNDLKKPEWAEDAYNAIRARSDDIAKIAKNTGTPEAKIQRIKHHLFYDDTHILSIEERIGRFSPDHEIAAAWDRLSAGDFIENDIRLLKHEYFESRFEKIFKTDYNTAHDRTMDAGRKWEQPNYKDAQ